MLLDGEEIGGGRASGWCRWLWRREEVGRCRTRRKGDIARLEKVHTPHMHVDEFQDPIVEEKLGNKIQTNHLDAHPENSANAE